MRSLIERFRCSMSRDIRVNLPITHEVTSVCRLSNTRLICSESRFILSHVKRFASLLRHKTLLLLLRMNSKVIHSIGIIEKFCVAWIGLNVSPPASFPSTGYKMHLPIHCEFVFEGFEVGLRHLLHLASKLLLLITQS